MEEQGEQGRHGGGSWTGSRVRDRGAGLQICVLPAVVADAEESTAAVESEQEGQSDGAFLDVNGEEEVGER